MPDMQQKDRLRYLCLANSTVLITHQIDAAYWHEWELFLIPGGNQVNMLLNIPVIAWVLYAHGRVVADTETGLPFYKLLACLGLLTAGIHCVLFVRGSESFIQPMSVVLLTGTLVLSLWQLIALRSVEKPL